MRPIILALAFLALACEDEDMLTTEITEWASGTTNKTTPSPAEIALGHIEGSEARSDWVNERSGLRDRKINASLEWAQAASSWYPIDSNDKARVAGQMQNQSHNSAIDPNGAVCRLDIADDFKHVTPGWDWQDDHGCIYLTMLSDIDSVYRVNTWHVGSMSLEQLDLDMTNVYEINGLTSDGSYLYLAYSNSSTSTYHLAKLSLQTWSGLAIEDRDTGWSYTAGAGTFIDIRMARVGVLGAFYNNAGTPSGMFGVWQTDDSAWVTGSGNLSGVSNYDWSNSGSLRATYNSLYMVSHVSATPGYRLVNCSVDNPATTASDAPSDDIAIKLNASYEDLPYVVLNGRIIMMDGGGVLRSFVDDGTSDWAVQTIGGVADNGYHRDSALHYGEILPDGAGRTWLMYRVDDTETVSGNVSLAVFSYDFSRYDYNMPTTTAIDPPHVAIPLGSIDSQTTSSQKMVHDGRNLVVVERFGSGSDTSVVRVITNPGGR